MMEETATPLKSTLVCLGVVIVSKAKLRNFQNHYLTNCVPESFLWPCPRVAPIRLNGFVLKAQVLDPGLSRGKSSASWLVDNSPPHAAQDAVIILCSLLQFSSFLVSDQASSRKFIIRMNIFSPKPYPISMLIREVLFPGFSTQCVYIWKCSWEG